MTLETELIAVAAELADAAREATLLHFRAEGLTADTKEQTRFDPVTVADRLSETRMRAILAARRPQDGILGEEFAPVAGTSGLTWVHSDVEKVRAVQATIAAAPAPIRAPRELRPAVRVDDGPLVLVETRKDLSQLKLPFDNAAQL